MEVEGAESPMQKQPPPVLIGGGCIGGAILGLIIGWAAFGGDRNPDENDGPAPSPPGTPPVTFENLLLETTWDKGGSFPGYVGCHKDGGVNDRRLPVQVAWGGATPKTCNEACQTASGGPYKFFGLQYFGECFCGNGPVENLGEKVDDSECFYPCTGDDNYICGGIVDGSGLNYIYDVNAGADYSCAGDPCKCLDPPRVGEPAAFCATATIKNTIDFNTAVDVEFGVVLPNGTDVQLSVIQTDVISGNEQMDVKFVVWEKDLHGQEGGFSVHLGHAGYVPGDPKTLIGMFHKLGHYLTAPSCPGSNEYCTPTSCCPGIDATGGKSFPCPVAQLQGPGREASEDAKKCDVSNWEDVSNAIIPHMTRDEKYRFLRGTGWFGDSFPKFKYYIGNSADRQRFGIPTMNHHDSGNGFRNDVVNTGTTVQKDQSQVTSWPVALALASLWSEVAMTNYGTALAKEFRAKGANMLLGPAVNVHRVPRCGRNAEYLSGESPYLGLRLTKPYIRAVQANRVLSSVKHFINNNQESHRHWSNSISDNRTRWELYYPPFEAAVEADVAAQMCGYNLVNGIKNCQNREVMQVHLKDDMGFKGFVQSDWWALSDFDTAIAAGIDQEMPGHRSSWFDYYFKDANLNKLTDAQVNKMLKPQLDMMLKYRLLEPDANTCEFGGRCNPLLYNKIITNDAHEKQSKDTATRAVTLLKNANVDAGQTGEGAPVLPLNKDTVKKIALLGSACHHLVDWEDMFRGWTNRRYYFIGGSGRVVPHEPVTIYQGLKKYCAGADDGHLGCYREFSTDGNFRQEMTKVMNNGATPALCRQKCMENEYTPPGAPGDSPTPVNFTHFGLQFHKECWCGIESQIGVKAPLGECNRPCDADKGIMCGGGNRNNIYKIETDDTPASCEIIYDFSDDHARAIQRATEAGAEVAITCGGQTSTEEEDRADLKVVENDYIVNVAAGLKATMPVIVLTMTPGTIIMPWRDDVKGMLNVFFPGKHAGDAFADNIFGTVNPSAKTPIFYPKEEAGTTVPCVEQTGPYRDCVYTEKLKIAWMDPKWEDANQPQYEILFPFGHGLSYTTFSYSELNVYIGADVATHCPAGTQGLDPDRGNAIVCITAKITNAGAKKGVEIAQMYIKSPLADGQPAGSEGEPEKLHKGFNRLPPKLEDQVSNDGIAPGAFEMARFPIHPRDLQVYSNSELKWKEANGQYTFMVGRSSTDLPLSGTFTMNNGVPSLTSIDRTAVAV